MNECFSDGIFFGVFIAGIFIFIVCFIRSLWREFKEWLEDAITNSIDDYFKFKEELNELNQKPKKK